jgi:hypothetical protein
MGVIVTINELKLIAGYIIRCFGCFNQAKIAKYRQEID